MGPSLASRLAVRERPTDRPPVMFQKWRELLFLHWQVEPNEIQQTLPPGLQVDTYADKAYLGIVPFYMCDVRPRFCPAVPGLSNFLEINLRTYVYDENGVAGVWFYSLDANQWLAVQLARTFFKLPYFYASMSAKRDVTGEISYSTWRRGSEPAERSHFHYQALGPLRHAEPGSLEFFLVERYILFTTSDGSGRLAAGQVHHPPYPICEAAVPVWDANLIGLGGFELPLRDPDHILMSPGVTVDIFGLQSSV